MIRTCEHGLELGKSSLAGAWNGGIAFCQCHLANYGYIDSWYSFARQDGTQTSGGTVNDKNLCPACGGQARSIGSDA